MLLIREGRSHEACHQPPLHLQRKATTVTSPQFVREAWRSLGRQLAELRKSAGLTQHTFAPKTLYGRSTIANVETGHQQPDRMFWVRCDEALQTGGLLTAGYHKIIALDQEYRRTRSQHLQAVPAQHSAAAITDTVVADRPAGDPTQAHCSPVQRRAMLLAGIAGVASASGLLDWPGSDRRLGVADVDRLRAVTALYRSVDHECGGGALHPAVARFADAASNLLSGRYNDAVRPNLLTAIAEVRQLAGWTAFDVGSHADAQRHWLSAERTAIAADDIRLAARVRYCQAQQFQHLRHNHDAIETLCLARDHVGTAATPAITAMLDGAEAASLAALGQHKAARTRLASATEAYGRVDPDREPDWMSFFNRGEVFAQHGRVYRDMARHDPRHGPQAVHWTRQAVAAFGPSNARSSVLNQVGLCSALFLSDEPDEAVAVGAVAIAYAQQLTSTQVIDRVHNLRRDLTRHVLQPAVRDFGDALTTIGAVSA